MPTTARYSAFNVPVGNMRSVAVPLLVFVLAGRAAHCADEDVQPIAIGQSPSSFATHVVLRPLYNNNMWIIHKPIFLSHFYVCACVVGLFPARHSVEQMAFELAVHKVNLDPRLSKRVKLEGRVEIVDIDDGYQTSKRG